MKKNIKKAIFCIVLLCLITNTYGADPDKKKHINSKYNCSVNFTPTITAISNGDWNTKATWGEDRIPSINDDVLIPNGIRVKLSGISNARSISLSGTLSPSSLDTSFELITRGIMIQNGGLMQIGSTVNPYSAKGIITLTGNNPDEELFFDPEAKSPMGSKLIGVMNGGRLELHGVAKQSWTHLEATVNPGAKNIRLSEPVNWSVNDEIVIASTDFDAHQAENKIIASISSNKKLITLKTRIKNMHWGTLQTYNNGTKDLILDERAEVGLLTHNLKIQGDDDSNNNGYGGHIMSMPGSVSRASNIELYQMGQKSALARYPWHWHFVGDATGQYIKNAGIHKSFNRAITVHSTDNTIVEGNVAFDFLGHGFFLEDGNEVGNKFLYNLGVLCKRPISGEETSPNDIGIGAARGVPEEAFPTTFWITNPYNDFIGNVAAGSDGSGFWHLILNTPLNDLGLTMVPGTLPMGVFDDNKAHSNLFNWGVDSGINKDSEELVDGHYKPQENGTQFVPIVNRFTGYKSVDRNVWIRGNKMEFYDCKFADNGRSNFFSYHQILYNSLIVGKSENIGNPISASEIEAGRTLPFPYLPMKDFKNGFRGHSIYDGPSGVVDTHFAGFDSNGADAFCFQTNGASRKSTNHFARGITFADDIPEANKIDFTNNPYLSYMFLSGIIDEDGSITGVPGSHITPIISSHPNGLNLYEEGFNTQQDNRTKKTEWGAWITEIKNYNYFRESDEIERSVAFTPRYIIAEYPNKSTHAVFNVQTQNKYFDAPVITNDLNYRYYFQHHKFPNLMKPSINGCKTNSENTIIAYTNMPSTVVVNNATQVSNLNELKNSTQQAYYLKNNTLYAKLISNGAQKAVSGQWQFGQDYRFQSTALKIFVDGNTANTKNTINEVTLIDYASGNGNDTRDIVVTTDGLTKPKLTYPLNTVSFNVQNNGNGIDGYSDYIINLEARQVWEYFNTLNLNYEGPDVQLLIEDTDGNRANLGTYNQLDSRRIRIGQNALFAKFSKVKKLVLRFKEAAIGNINTVSNSDVKINDIKLGSDIPSLGFSISSSSVIADKDGDGLSNIEESDKCRNISSASDFALEFNGKEDLFDGYQEKNIDGVTKVFGGVLEGKSLNTDPQIIRKNFINLSGSEIDQISINLRIDTPNARVQLFWENEDGGFSATRTVFKNYTGNGAPQTLTFDMSSNNQWNGKTIKSLRIDPTNKSNTTFKINFIRANNAVPQNSQCLSAKELTSFKNALLLTDETVEEQNEIILYPNPVVSGKEIHIKGLNSYQNTQIEVRSLTGKTIQYKKTGNTLELQNTNAGMYFVRFFIEDENKVIIKKLFIK